MYSSHMSQIGQMAEQEKTIIHTNICGVHNYAIINRSKTNDKRHIIIVINSIKNGMAEHSGPKCK